MKKPPRYIATIRSNDPNMWIQGFDVTGMPITGTMDTAHRYPSLGMAHSAIHNAIRAGATDHNAIPKTSAIVQV